MYEVGDWIIYGSNGVCRVESVGRPEGAGGLDKDKEYYKLSPLLDSSVIYAPVETKVFMRPAISREEAEELIAGIPAVREESYSNRNLRLLTEHYKEAFASHECEDLLRLIKAVCEKNRTCVKNGKRPGQIDQRYLKRAEELLHGELSVALDIPFGEVQGYIETAVQKLEVSAG